ncbi:hypothetical protein UCRPC4_g02261 [Phaeomoniella chlamydospora]|uniref:Auxiliary Activity family 9 catalytic domain-containing protein n=1 Tax=Phaeomoniella chlamydospora TaxID=158046 RepID=A0A0G2H8G4_PHACM|nr:hypothetical protein UCRPC4_g02261 [Phaeomoniella chlamydospora]
MSMSKLAVSGALAALISLVPQVAAHAYVSGVVVDDTYYGGYLVNQYPYESDPPDVIAWSTDATDLGYVNDYSSADIICHKNASNAQTSATVAAGKDITFEWTTWPESHHGPVISYLASCDGECETVDKTTLEFVKFDASGLLDNSEVPGTWASDELISNNNSWTLTIPSSITAGNYVLRHEIIALHSAGSEGGAQNYPQCFNLKITGSGTSSPTGTLGQELYSSTDPGILINIYSSISSYTIPGPAIPSEFASSDSSSSDATTTAASSVATSSVAASSVAASSVVATSSVAATTSAAVATSAAATISTQALQAASAATISTQALQAASAATEATSSAVVATTVASSATAVSSVATSAAAAASATATTSVSTVSTSGMSVSELLALLKQVLSQLFTDYDFNTTSTKARRHARDLTIA